MPEYFDDDGTPLNPDLGPTPSLCTVCRHRDDPKQEERCNLNRLDQAGEDKFQCEAFERARDESRTKPPEDSLQF